MPPTAKDMDKHDYCFRCGDRIYKRATPCAFIQSGGPPSSWDIERYAAGLNVKVPNQDRGEIQRSLR